MQSTARVCDVAFNSVVQLLADGGKACESFHDKTVRGVQSKRVQCNEIWRFVYAKAKNVETAKTEDRLASSSKSASTLKCCPTSGSSAAII